MKYLLLVLLSFNSFANVDLQHFFRSSSANNVCQMSIDVNGSIIKTNLKFIKADKQNALFVFNNGYNTLIKIFDLATGTYRSRIFERTKIVDVLFHNQDIILLAENRFIVIDRLSTVSVLESLTLPAHLSYGRNALATSVKRQGNILYVSHGIHGVIKYDATTYQFLGQIIPKVTQPESFHLSAVTGVEITNNNLYMAMDDVTLAHKSKAFEGVVLYDLKTEQKVREIPVNQRQEAYYKPRLQIEGDELYVTNLNYIFKHRIEQIQSDRYMNPYYRIWKYPNGEIVGRGFIQNKTLYGCFFDYTTGVKRADIVNI